MQNSCLQPHIHFLSFPYRDSFLKWAPTEQLSILGLLSFKLLKYAGPHSEVYFLHTILHTSGEMWPSPASPLNFASPSFFSVSFLPSFFSVHFLHYMSWRKYKMTHKSCHVFKPQQLPFCMLIYT